VAVPVACGYEPAIGGCGGLSALGRTPNAEPVESGQPSSPGTGSNVAKQGWGDISDAKAVRRLGELLGVAFDAEPIGELGGSDGALALIGEDAWVALQVERKHNHPVENVLQYWRWLERSRRRLVLVHAITPGAPKHKSARAELCPWVGAMMERVLPGRFTYCRLDLGSAEEAQQLLDAWTAIASLRQPRDGRGLLALS
jgi:hypothetical protein